MIDKTTKNEKLGKILNGLADNIYRYRYVCLIDDERYEHRISEHRELYRMIVSGDREGAAKAAANHVDLQWEYLRKQFREEKSI